MIDNAPADFYEFDQFRVDVVERLLFESGKPINLPPKIFDTLLLLVSHPGKALAKDEMMEAIWTDSFVEENNLAQNISYLRRVFGKEAHYIETVPKRGYRFVAPVEVVDEPGEITSIGNASPAVGSVEPPETSYVRNGDVNIAYQIVGNGPVDIVFVMGWVSHLEYSWKHHLFASFLERLASFSRLILFDKRGTGLSDRVPIEQLPTLEQRIEDVNAVMDAAGSKRAILIGVSEGGPMCSLFAATYPERTSGLIMIGTYAKRIRDDDYPWAPTTEQRQAFFDQMLEEWGGPVGIEERAPSMADDEQFCDWWATYLRMGASPGAAVALTKMNAEIDIRGVLPSIRVPTLVMHRRGDICLKVEEGRYVASKIPGSRFVELMGDDHLPFVGDQSEIFDEIERFIAGTPDYGEFDRVLTTVMSIRIADFSAESKKRRKDEWRSLLSETRRIVAHQLELFRGREIAYEKSGMIATFDGPARAIRCASAITAAAETLGVEIKTGLHTGECNVSAGIYSGFAVDLARDIANHSSNGRILVSRTVTDLVAGSGLVFKEYSRVKLIDTESDWLLYEVQ